MKCHGLGLCLHWVVAAEEGGSHCPGHCSDNALLVLFEDYLKDFEVPCLASRSLLFWPWVVAEEAVSANFHSWFKIQIKLQIRRLLLKIVDLVGIGFRNESNQDSRLLWRRFWISNITSYQIPRFEKINSKHVKWRSIKGLGVFQFLHLVLTEFLSTEK